MTSVVIDASVTAAWCFEDEETRYAREILRRAERIEFVVAAIWPIEMVNVFLVNERRKRITPAETARAMALFQELAIEVDSVSDVQPFQAVLPVARAYGLSSYDACYLELALREGLPLATLDERLREAAREAGVPLFE